MRAPSITRTKVRAAALGAALLAALGHSTATPAATLIGNVTQGGTVISDSNGFAEILPGETATVTILLDLAGEQASVLEGRYDLIGTGLSSAADVAAVESDWDSVVENTTGTTSAWSALSAPLGGPRLAARWQVDATAATPGNVLTFTLAADSFVGTDILVPPFFELLPLEPTVGTPLARVTIVPEPSTGLLVLSALAAFSAARRSTRRRSHSTSGRAGTRSRPDAPLPHAKH